MAGQLLMFSRIIDSGKLIKFSHSIFALPFAIIGLFLASHHIGQVFPPVILVTMWLICMIAARSSAMAFNRIVDYKFDCINPRTATRELPSGKLSLQFAKFFLIACMIVFIAASAMFLRMYKNPWPLLFAPLVLIFICTYSYSKRFTSMSHFWLGASLGLAPVASWVAVSPPIGNIIGWPVISLGIAVMFWTAGFDIIYSLSDIDFDRQNGLYSIPAKLGITGSLNVSRMCHFAAFIFLALLIPVFGKFYVVGLGLAAIIFVAEHMLIGRNLKYINTSFFTLNGIFSILFAICAITDILLH